MEWVLDGRGTLQGQLARCLRQSVQRAALRPGERLPGSRSLAEALGLSRTTVLLALEQLVAEGYLEARPRSGTFVSAGALGLAAAERASPTAPCRPKLSSAGRRLARELDSLRKSVPARRSGIEGSAELDFRYSLGRAADFPLAAWRRALATTARQLPAGGFRYPPVEGSEALRGALAGYLRRTRGLPVNEADLLILGGSQQGLDLAIRLLLDPGDVAVLENPHYPAARLALRACGARIVAIRADASGLDTGRLAARSEAIRLVHVTPSHQFPLGGVMPLSRRVELLSWADERDAMVVEDDYNSEFRLEGRPVEPLASLDRAGRVLHLGTFSKVLLPSLRLGFLVLPAALRSAFVAAKLVADQGRALLEQEALALFIRDGSFERHVRRVRRRQRERREQLVDAVATRLGSDVRIHGASGGLHVVLELCNETPRDVPRIVEDAAAAGVGVYDLAPYFMGRPRFAGLLLGTASLDGPQIAEGIRRLGVVLRGAR